MFTEETATPSLIRTALCLTTGMRTHRHTLILPILLTASLGLVACGSADDDTPVDPGPQPEAPAPEAPENPEQPAPEPDTEQAPNEDQNESGADNLLEGVTRTALAALDMAEAETGGIAYELSDENDNTVWEIDIDVNGDDVKVRVNWAGTEIMSSEPDGSIDVDTREKLESISVTIQDAIVVAAEHADGRVSEADLDREDGVMRWEVTFENDSNDTEVYIDATSGEVLRVDND